MPKASIPPEIQAEAQKLIDEFNSQHFKKANAVTRAFFGNKVKPGYSARFKGKYLYLDRNDHIKPSPICRLTWNGKMDDWSFAIYKYSGNSYDPEEWFFPRQRQSGWDHTRRDAGRDGSIPMMRKQQLPFGFSIG